MLTHTHTRTPAKKIIWGNVETNNYTGFVVELHEGVLDMKGFSSTARQKTVVVQPLSDQNLVNREFGGHLKNGRYATISQKLRGVEPSLLTLYIYMVSGA